MPGKSHPPARPLRVGVVHDPDQAEAIVQRLLAAGFTKDQITVVCSDQATERRFHDYEHQEPAGFYTPKALAIGAGCGAAVGLVTAVLMVGVDAGILALGAALTGTGTLVGGFLGVMLTRAVEGELSNYYDQEVAPGDILVAAEDHGQRAGEHLHQAEEILTSAGVKPIELSEG